MTRDEIVVHLVAGMLASKPFNRQAEIDQVSDIKAMHAIAGKHADEILRTRRDAPPYYEKWRDESVRWLEWACQLQGTELAMTMKPAQLRADLAERVRVSAKPWELETVELLKQAGKIAIHAGEDDGDEDLRASLVATFMAMLRLLNGVADGSTNADAVRRALGRIP